MCVKLLATNSYNNINFGENDENVSISNKLNRTLKNIMHTLYYFPVHILITFRRFMTYARPGDFDLAISLLVNVKCAHTWCPPGT